MMMMVMVMLMLMAVLNGKRPEVSSLAGGFFVHNQDGLGTNAGFFEPWGVAVDLSGNVFVADWANPCIRKVTSGGGTSIDPVTLRACCAEINVDSTA